MKYQLQWLRTPVGWCSAHIYILHQPRSRAKTGTKWRIPHRRNYCIKIAGIFAAHIGLGVGCIRIVAGTCCNRPCIKIWCIGWRGYQNSTGGSEWAFLDRPKLPEDPETYDARIEEVEVPMVLSLATAYMLSAVLLVFHSWVIHVLRDRIFLLGPKPCKLALNIFRWPKWEFYLYLMGLPHKHF